EKKEGKKEKRARESERVYSAGLREAEAHPHHALQRGTNPQHDIKLFRAETFPASEETSVLKLEATRWLTRSAVLPFEPPLLPPHPLLCLFQHVLSRHCHQGVSTCDPSTAFSKIPTVSRTARASEGPVFTGVCKYFSRSKGHGFITPSDGGADIFVHISDIEGEYVPVEGDEVSYKVCCIPPKLEKIQAVEVTITHLKPGTKHETWSGRTVDS
uniref:Calcium regulated heat stable protein 1 n=1 Tax=Haplochromis burtoni TaxID=8153 RepID=A0A3Q2WWK7_HAPBU